MILLYYIFKGIDSEKPLDFINMEVLLESLNYYIFNSLLERHNKVVKKINEKNVGEVKNRNDYIELV